MDINTEIQAEKSDLPEIKQKLKIYQLTVIFSLFFALVGFSYNVWRMELSEHNNNIRSASFEMLLELSAFEQLIYTAYYDKDLNEGSPRKAWVKVGLVNDLSSLTTTSIEKEAQQLRIVWRANEQGLTASNDSQVMEIVKAIDATRDEIKTVLKSLD